MAALPENWSALSEQELEELDLLLAYREKDAQDETLSQEERQRIQRRAELEADFASFVRAAWHVIRPGQQLKWSWHYDLICEYLTLAFERKCLRLIINISPRTLKSILVTVMFPVWIWTKQPIHSIGCASYSIDLSTEHSVMRRTIIESDWFRALWGDRVWLADDQNQKTKYKNNFQAQMWASSVGATIQGLGGITLIVDDALKSDDATSEVKRKSATDWFDGTWERRLDDPATGCMIVVEQRVHELDVSGFLLERGGWTHLCLPLEAEKHERWEFPISGRVVERQVGEILQPDRFPPSVVEHLKKLRLVWSGQYQQHPAPLEGNMIKRADVRYYGGRDPVTGEPDRALPTKFSTVLVSGDCAFKDLKTSDYVAAMTVATAGPDRFILDLVLAHLDEPATEMEILRQRRAYGANLVLVEDKANGPAVIKRLRQKIPGVIEVNPQGGKVARMFAVCGEWQSGNWYVPRNAAWTDPFIQSITTFPAYKYDDDADAMTQAGIYLQQNSYGTHGFIEAMKRLQEEQALAKQGKLSPKKKAETNPPSGETKALASETTAVAKPAAGTVPTEEVVKVDVPDNVDRCPECASVIIQRVAGGKRCGQCGHQWQQKSFGVNMSGQVRK